ncbi:MAG: 1-acyl-sn-glycerol-3-phosphate acyltransferase [Saprospiraceae bacterium]
MLKAIARFIMWIWGWSVPVTETPPEAQRSVMIAAPHTSNWDFIWTVLGFYVLDIPMRVTIKNDWTKMFIVGWIIKKVGGVGVDRSPRQPGEERLSLTDAMADLFKKHDRLAMIVTPEGTRSLRTEWKKGFYFTALKAGVPITCGYLDYKNKLAGVGPVVVHPTGDMEKDLVPIMEFYKDIAPRYPKLFSVDQKYLPSPQ